MKKHIKKECMSVAMVKVLPAFKGYTVDVRLRQFRKADPGKQSIEFVDFSSPEGDDLLEEYIGTLDKDSTEFREIATYIFTR